MRFKKKNEILITHYTYKNEISRIFYSTNILPMYKIFLCNMQHAYHAGNNEHVCDRNCKSVISA